MSLEQASLFNVEASINASFRTALTGYTLPSWLPTRPALVYDWAAGTLMPPVYGAAHIPVGVSHNIMGRHVGEGEKGGSANGILELSAFVTKANNPNWNAQLRTMRDWVTHWAISTASIRLRDYQASATAPAGTSYLVRLDALDAVATEADPNPNIIRARLLVPYSFTYRV